MSEQDSTLASQCLAFCQTLASQGRTVSFSLKIGSCFSFSLDTKDEVKVPADKARTKQSPSTKRRNQRRRNEFLASKEALPLTEKTLNHEETPDESVLELKTAEINESEKSSFSCDECGHKTKKENGTKLHMKKKHEVPQIDGSIFISKEKEVQTQTDVFLNISAECEIVGSDLADIYFEPYLLSTIQSSRWVNSTA